jgi:hypothetical protein
MIETNLRIIRFGKELRFDVRRVEVSGHVTAPELLEKACNRLSSRHGLSAVRDSQNRNELLVHSNRPVPALVIEDENWRLDISDVGNRRLSFGNESERVLLATLIERSLIRKIFSSRLYWNLDSYRIYYSREPLDTIAGIQVFRRFEVATLPIDDVGIGIPIDISTAFFTEQSVAWFFDAELPIEEQKARKRKFNRLSQRQDGSKGTLVYESKPGQFSKCYFEGMLPNATVGNPDVQRIRGETFASLKEYYQRKHGVLLADAETVAKVSFPGIPYSVPVAASRLRLRVMNDALPRSLSSIDKIPPDERRALVESFWKNVGDHDIGPGVPGLADGFWRPKVSHVFRSTAPDLLFGDGNILKAPSNGSVREHRDYYGERLPYLSRFGCFSYPGAAPRTLYIAVPAEFGSDVADALSNSVVNLYSELTRTNTEAECILYASQAEAITKLQSERFGGMVLFVFDDDSPASYFNVEYELKGWRVKRIKKSTLARYAGEFRFKKQNDGTVCPVQFPARWKGFVELNVMGLVQQIDGVPWTLKNPPKYQMRLGIDVSQGHRFFAVSLLIFRPTSTIPFRMETEVENKTDSKKETINELILEDKIVELAERAISSGFSDLESMLVVRDGRQCGNEIEAILAAERRMKDMGLLRNDAVADIVDFHKVSVKNIRIWEVLRDGRAVHAIEGTGIRLSSNSALLANTGAATLRQGTAEPVMIRAVNPIDNIVEVANDLHQSCHLNWSNPRVAQRLPMEIKRTDEELTSRTAQEVRRIK